MSSIIDSKINEHCVTNRRTVTLSLDLSQGSSKEVDLTTCEYGQLDFVPDDMYVKYISYTSCGNAPANVMPIMTCNFLSSGQLLAPYFAKNSITTFEGLRYKIKQQMDIRHVTIASKVITGDINDSAYTSGTVLISLEFIRYQRNDESWSY